MLETAQCTNIFSYFYFRINWEAFSHQYKLKCFNQQKSESFFENRNLIPARHVNLLVTQRLFSTAHFHRFLMSISLSVHSKKCEDWLVFLPSFAKKRMSLSFTFLIYNFLKYKNLRFSI
jgi:hypothetical protein